MPRLPSIYLSSILFAGAACGAGPLHAAELGEVRVGSHIGQALVADIELAMLEDAGQTVQVRVADAEVYSGAGIAMPPVLATLHLSVTRRDGRQFLHVTSLRPVEGDHLHLYLDLDEHGQHSVRLATLWLTPDPTPAPPPAPAPAPVVAPVVAPVAVPVVSAMVAAPPAVPPAVPSPAPAPAVVREAPPPAPAAPRRVPARPTPAPAPARAVLAALHAAPAPACVHPSEEAQACIALGVKNAELRTELGKLEQTVRGLQVSLVQPEAPKPINAIRPLVPRKSKAPEADEGLPWGIIGVALGVLLAGGAGVALALRRRRRKGAAPPAAEPSLD